MPLVPLDSSDYLPDTGPLIHLSDAAVAEVGQITGLSMAFSRNELSQRVWVSLLSGAAREWDL